MAGAHSPDEGTPQQPPAHRRFLVPAVIIAVTALLIATVLALQADGDQDDAAPTESVPDQASLEHPSEVALPDLSSEVTRDADDLLAEGPVDAPVVMVVFTDFQCPYCASWSHETLPTLREYVERGQLRIEWRDVNVYGEDSERAARASLAAAMQGEHTEYQQALFAGGEIRSSEELSEDALIALAGELGLDVEQFTADLHSDRVARTIEYNAAQGAELGAVTTPSFIIDGTPTVGAQPTEVFVDLIDEALEQKDG